MLFGLRASFGVWCRPDWIVCRGVHYLAAGLMFVGGLIAWFFGVNAKRKSLEEVASPLSAVAPSAAATATARER